MTEPSQINQLIMIVVAGSQAGELTQQLTQNGFYYTKVDSSGGIIQEPLLCLFIGLDKERLATLMSIVRHCCKPYRQYIPTTLPTQPGPILPPMIEAQIGGATIYSMDVERFEQL